MTFIDIVNNVLRRLRESEVSTVSESTYSKMVGDFVNDAKRLVEDAWDWSQLKQTTTITGTPGASSLTLPFTVEDKVLYIYDDTSKKELEYKPLQWFEENVFLNDSVESGDPSYYTFFGSTVVSNSIYPKIMVYPYFSSFSNVRVTAVDRKAPFSADNDYCYIPTSPIIHLAVALLARERGETGGTSTAEYFAIADKYLSDAIAMDAAKAPEATIWYTP